MDYEKRVKQMIADEAISKEVAAKYFPELAESEDEQMRKKCIELIKELKKFCMRDGQEECIAWLKKQGEQPTDKVEPKFKVGDWLQYRNAKPFLVKEITRQGYVNGDDCLPFSWENEIHLWTIQDAKDGDVLYLLKDGKEHIIIYKGVLKERFRTFVSAYCAYNGVVDAFCFADVSRYVDIAYGGIMPATKEQRDTLMKSMVDEGYEWDVEKKELKEIEKYGTD